MAEAGRVLIADDEETFLLSTADLLRKEGYECDCAIDSQTARQLIGEKQYDLLIADIKMPGNAELEFINELPTLVEGLPVVLVTGYPSLKSAIESVRLPVVAYLVKPIDFDELLPYVRSSTEKSQVRRAVQKARQHLRDWHKELENIETLADFKEANAASVPVDAFVTLTLHNIVDSLTGLKALTEAFADISGEQNVCQLLDCPRAAQLTQALKDAVKVLEKTKRSFKSKDLAGLRQKLEQLLGNAQK